MAFEVRSVRAGANGEQTRFFVLDSGFPMASNPREGHKTFAGAWQQKLAIERSLREFENGRGDSEVSAGVGRNEGADSDVENGAVDRFLF